MKSRFLSRTLALVLACLFVVTSFPLSALAAPEAEPPLEAEAVPAVTPLAEGDEELPIYLDTSYTFKERATDLVSRMTLAEKQAQLGNNNPAIPRLGVIKYDYWNEGLHGVAKRNHGPATSFPTSLGMAATWDPDLVQRTTTVTSTEARAMFNDRDTVFNGSNIGLTYWSPTINLSRDPRWGRADESMGEDPYLTSVIGSGFVSGMQGHEYFTPDEEETYLRVVSTLKHYAANNSEFNRHDGNSQLTDAEIREYYTYPYKEIVQNTNVQSLMTAYNRVNEIPMSANTYMVDTLLRRTFGFTGFITSDCGAIEDMFSATRHNWVPDDWDTATLGEFAGPGATAYGLTAGTDMDCGSIYPRNAIEAIGMGIMTEDDIDVALVRIFTARMMTGEFDPDGTEWDDYTVVQGAPNQVICTDPDCTAADCDLDHARLAEEAADSTVVLLENDGILPLNAAELDKVALVGTHADEVILGGYSVSLEEARHTSSPREALEGYLEDEGVGFRYIQGTTQNSAPYTMNFLSLVLYRGDQREEIPASASAEQMNCILQGNRNIGYCEPDGAWVRWEDVDLTGVTKVAFTMSGSNTQSRDTQVELRASSPNGHLMAQIERLPHTTGWDDYVEFEAVGFDQGGYTDDIYVCFRESVSAGLSDEDVDFIQSADAVIVYAGTHTGDSSEGRDRTTLDLPRGQSAMIEQIVALNPKTVVYMQTVSQVDVEDFKDDVAALLWCCYNGQAQGNAMVRTLFGKNNPSGKLPVTWYADQNDLPDIDDYNIYATGGDSGRTYQYFTGEVSYPFGYGLSYTEFAYSDLELSASSVTPDDTLTVSFTLKNTGDALGREVAQVYIASPGADENPYRPAMRLKGFDKIALEAGESTTVTIDIPMSDLYFWDEANMIQTFDQGQYTVLVGPSSGEHALTGYFNLSGQLTPALDVVTVIPSGHVINMVSPINAIESKLTAVYNNEAFVDLERDAQVTFRSLDETVAQVDSAGFVTGVGPGVTSIEVTVTVGGKSGTDSFPVKVEGESVMVAGIFVDGALLRGYSPDKTAYTHWLDDLTTLPVVTASPVEGVGVTIDQATAEQPVATVTAVREQDEATLVYTIRFAKEPVGMDFTEPGLTEADVTGKFDIINPDSDYWDINSPEGLLIRTQGGDLQGEGNSANNIFHMDVDGDWTAELKVFFPELPSVSYQQAGILVMDDVDNYLKLGCEANSGSQTVNILTGLEIEHANSQRYNKTLEDMWEAKNVTIRFRVEKDGDTFYTYFAINDGDFEQLGAGRDLPIEEPKVGFYGFNNTGDAPSLDVYFHSLTFTVDDEDLQPELTLQAPVFAGQQVGYTQPAAQPLTIVNRGDGGAYVTAVEFGEDSVFSVSEGNNWIPAGSTDKSWLVRPQAGLPEGDYTETLTLTYNDELEIETDITFSVLAKAERYTVTFDSRGGSPVVSQDIAAGGLVNRPANPTRSSYRFTGWFKDVACTQAWDFAVDTVTGDITLYAGWERTSTSTPNPAPKPDPEPEPEPGKTTETETRDDGTVITTETNTETGDQTVTIESPDGTVTAVDKPRDGDITAEITVPDDVDETVVPIPLDDLDGGTVAVIVHPDGTEEIIKGSIGADGTLYVPVDGDVTIKIVDNRKDFDDSADARWAADAIAFVTARELFLGTSDTAFSPNLPMTRGMLATVLWRLEGEPEAGENPFTDVRSDAYYAEAVAWAAEAGVVAGVGENTFAPGDDISREQLAVMLYRYAGEPETAGGLTGYTDGDSVSSWAEEAMAWAVEQGIITGRTTTTLEPLGEATRAEVATMLQRYVLYLTTI